ncbi:ATP-dependent helicase [Nitratifractor sp.]
MPLRSLNEEQRRAATAPAGNNLIIASAGTGKTSTIVGRIAFLLNEGLPPEKILLLTFTNKAAGEMIARLKRYFPSETVDRIEAGTFHAVCYRWLKARRPNLALKQPGELRTLFRSIYERRDFLRLGRGEPFSSQYLFELYQLYQNATLKSFDSWLLERYPDHEPLADIYLDIVEEFEETKDSYGFLSFNDLLLQTLRTLEEEGGTPFSEILVDEYQDTNTLQGALIDAMSPPSLFCVGDYDQSIYAFNGANIANISTFTERYPDARVYTLSVNYRSSAPILSLANRVIERNERIYPKELRVGKEGVPIPPKLLVYEELFEQYQSIAEQIRGCGRPYEEIAVIFRNNASADGIEASLRERGIPCRRKGGHSFFESKEVKFLLDLTTLLVNPRDMMAFIHIFEYGRGIGTALAKEIFLCLTHFGEGNLLEGALRPHVFTLPNLHPKKSTQLGLFDDDLEIGSVTRFAGMGLNEEILAHPLLKHPRLTPDSVRFFVKFYDFLRSVERIRRPATVMQRAIASLLYQHGVVDSLAAQRARLKNGEVDPEKEREARERIQRKARLLLDLSSHYSELRRFVNAMILGGGEMSEGEGVHLMTVHASKGLEFTDVYLVDLMDGRFPNRKLMERTGSLEEERRLFYVAVTRAKERLYLSMARYDRVKKIDFKPSPFLEEAGLIRIDRVTQEENASLAAGKGRRERE